jgi:hypothetical protein
MIRGETLRLRAVAAAPHMNLSALHIRSRNPAMIAAMLYSIFIGFVASGEGYANMHRNKIIE